MVYVYKFTNLINGKIYVGSTKDIAKRLKQHKLRSTYSIYKEHHFYRSVNKYGWESFMFDVIEECCPLLRNDRENHWIIYYGTLDNRIGYNMRLADNHEMSKETREKLSINRSGEKHHNYGKPGFFTGYKHTEETKEVLRIKSTGRPRTESELEKLRSIKGEKHHSFGTHPTEEARRKMSEAKQGEKHNFYGKKRPSETCEKIRIAATGRKKSQESIEKHRQKMLGRKQSDESRRKRSESMKRTIAKKKLLRNEEIKKKVKKLF